MERLHIIADTRHADTAYALQFDNRHERIMAVSNGMDIGHAFRELESAPKNADAFPYLPAQYSGICDALSIVVRTATTPPSPDLTADAKARESEESSAILRTLAMLAANGYRAGNRADYTEVFWWLRRQCDAPDANPGAIAYAYLDRYGITRMTDTTDGGAA